MKYKVGQVWKTARLGNVRIINITPDNNVHVVLVDDPISDQWLGASNLLELVSE